MKVTITPEPCSPAADKESMLAMLKTMPNKTMPIPVAATLLKIVRFFQAEISLFSRLPSQGGTFFEVSFSSSSVVTPKASARGAINVISG